MERSGGLGEPGRSSGDARMSEEAGGRNCRDVCLAVGFALKSGQKWNASLRAVRGSLEEECMRPVTIVPYHAVATPQLRQPIASR